MKRGGGGWGGGGLTLKALGLFPPLLFLSPFFPSPFLFPPSPFFFSSFPSFLFCSAISESMLKHISST